MNLDQRLTDAARHVADQVDPPEVDLAAVRSRARTGRRNRAVVALAAAVVTAVLVGIQLRPGRESTAPQPAAPTLGTAIRLLSTAGCEVDPCLEPVRSGAYRIGLGQGVDTHPVSATLTVPDGGWEANGFLHRIARRSAAGAVVLNVYRPSALAGAKPCASTGMRRLPEDATVDDVVGRLTALPQFALVDGPRAVPTFGPGTRYLRMEADRLSCPPGPTNDQYNVADIYGGDGLVPGGDSDIYRDQRVLIDFWVVDLDGRVIVVEARQEGSPDGRMMEALDQARASLTLHSGQ